MKLISYIFLTRNYFYTYRMRILTNLNIITTLTVPTALIASTRATWSNTFAPPTADITMSISWSLSIFSVFSLSVINPYIWSKEHTPEIIRGGSWMIIENITFHIVVILWDIHVKLWLLCHEEIWELWTWKGSQQGQGGQEHRLVDRRLG